MKHLQSEHECMTRDYNKMEQSSMEQQNIIIGLEQICQELKEQHDCQHRVWKTKTSFNCSNPRLERLVGNG